MASNIEIQVAFNCLIEEFKRSLQVLIDKHGWSIAELTNLFKDVQHFTAEVRREIENINQLFEKLIEYELIGITNVGLLRVIARGIRGLDVEKAIDTYEEFYKGQNQNQALLHLRMILSTTGSVAEKVLEFYIKHPEEFQCILTGLLNFAGARSGSVYFMITTNDLASLKQLQAKVKDGSLKEKVKQSINQIQGVKELTNGKEIDISLELELQEYQEAFWKLLIFKQIENRIKNKMASDTRMQRRHSICCEYDLNKNMDTHSKVITSNFERHLKNDIRELTESLMKAKDANICLEQRIVKQKEELESAQELYVEAIFKLANEYLKARKFDKARTSYKQCLYNSIATGNKNRQKLANEYLAAICHLSGDLEKAMYYYEETLAVAFDTDDIKTQSRTYGNMTLLCLSQDKYTDALKYCKKALKRAITIRNRDMEAITYGNFGLLYSGQDKKEQALEYFNKALQINIELGDELGKEKVEANLASLQIQDSS